MCHVAVTSWRVGRRRRCDRPVVWQRCHCRGTGDWWNAAAVPISDNTPRQRSGEFWVSCQHTWIHTISAAQVVCSASPSFFCISSTPIILETSSPNPINLPLASSFQLYTSYSDNENNPNIIPFVMFSMSKTWHIDRSFFQALLPTIIHQY